VYNVRRDGRLTPSPNPNPSPIPKKTG
jgi:hypothetical protein